MHITINRAELLAAVKRASTIAPPDSPLDVLRGVLLETDSDNGILLARRELYIGKLCSRRQLRPRTAHIGIKLLFLRRFQID